MNVFIRTDASAASGTGHLMRCLALANELRQRDATVSFITRAARQPWGDLIRAHGHGLIELPSTFPGAAEDLREAQAAVADAPECDWLVVDHYELGRNWESAMRPFVRRILAIDDLGRTHDCDALLDQNVMDDGGAYRESVPANCRRFFGPRYALLREEFAQAWRTAAHREGTCRHVLINFGGGDPTGETDKAIQAFLLADIDNARAQVVLGAANTDAATLRFRYGNHPRLEIIEQTDRMSALMAGADVAIGAGGISTWERAALGLPAIVVAVAENQAAIAEVLATRGLHCYLGRSRQVNVAGLAQSLRFLACNPWLRASFSQRSAALCDGAGARRIATQLIGGVALSLRRVAPTDSAALYAWRNAEEVRRGSLDPAPIARADHDRWFDGVLTDANRHQLIGTDAAGPVGVVRFDVSGDQAQVSIYLVPGRIGMGLGANLLAAAHEWLAANLPALREIRARVLADNPRSAALFEHAGYRPFDGSYRKTLSASGETA